MREGEHPSYTAFIDKPGTNKCQLCCKEETLSTRLSTWCCWCYGYVCRACVPKMTDTFMQGNPTQCCGPCLKRKLRRAQKIRDGRLKAGDGESCEEADRRDTLDGVCFECEPIHVGKCPSSPTPDDLEQLHWLEEDSRDK